VGVVCSGVVGVGGLGFVLWLLDGGFCVVGARGGVMMGL
jgi:hypothetical protein